MNELEPNDRNAIRDMLEQAEDKGLTRAMFLDQVDSWLDETQADATHHETALDYAAQRADRSNALASDRTLPSDIETAAGLLLDTTRRNADAPWLGAVLRHWPAPIAHELARLMEELQGRPGSEGQSLPPNPDAALLQLRDTGEALIKVAACILIRALIEAGGEAGDWARRSIFQGRLLLGNWVALLRESAKYTLETMPEGPIHSFARLCQRFLLPFANDFVEVRNQSIGHGARALDPQETARLVVGLLDMGKIRRADGTERSVKTLARTLTGLVENDAFVGWTLTALDDDRRFDLTGASATEVWLEDPRHEDHSSRSLPVEIQFPDGLNLSLAPLLAARICSQCGKRDVVIFDSLYDPRRGGRFDLVDYARGHKSRIWGSEAIDLGEAIQKLEPQDAPELAGDSLALGQVLLALDRARADRNYLSPKYLRRELTEFLTHRPGGVYWLQAPAHIGKSTFIHGLAGDTDLEDEPIETRFEPQANGRIVAYYCCKEYRTGVAGLINRLSDRLQAVYDPSDTRRNEQPDLLSRRHASPTPAQFIAWLEEWRHFGATLLRSEPGPLLVCIDGLDESEPPDPEGNWPLQILPTDEELPEGLYLVITSRIPDEEDAPAFLRERIAVIYGSEHTEAV